MVSVEESIAFVLDSGRGRPVGLAFLITDRLLLTCAHVVNTSLGRPLREASPIAEGTWIPLDFALLGSSDDWFHLDAKVAAWLPRANSLEFDSEDVAVLRLGQDLTWADAVPLKISTEAVRLRQVQMWGADAGERRGRHVLGQLMGSVVKHRLQVDEAVHGTPRVSRGFSGGPAWHPATGEVAGMLQAIHTDGSAEVFVLRGDVLRRAIAAATPRAGRLSLVHDHGEVEYDGETYSHRQSKVIHDSPVTLAFYEIEVLVKHSLHDDPETASAYHREHPLVADQLGIRAWCIRGTQREEMSCVPIRYGDAQIDFMLYFPEGGDLRPGQSARIGYAYAVSDRQWGQWYERRFRDDADRTSIAAHLPTDLEPECWGMARLPSRTGLEPLSNVVERAAHDKTIYSWDRTASEEGVQRGHRVRLEWFFWRRIRQSRATMDASDVMVQFGIGQVRGPRRGRPLPSHVPARAHVRSINLESADERELARRILGHLRRVAGWVARYHTFKPAVGMGIAAPQLGIQYRIAIVKRPHSEQFVELINPRVITESAELMERYERCLSFFDFRGIVRRPVSVTVAYDRISGKPAITAFTGALARNVQHEIDHLNGKLYTDEDRMPVGLNPMPVEDYRAIR